MFATLPIYMRIILYLYYALLLTNLHNVKIIKNLVFHPASQLEKSTIMVWKIFFYLKLPQTGPKLKKLSYSQSIYSGKRHGSVGR